MASLRLLHSSNSTIAKHNTHTQAELTKLFKSKPQLTIDWKYRKNIDSPFHLDTLKKIQRDPMRINYALLCFMGIQSFKRSNPIPIP